MHVHTSFQHFCICDWNAYITFAKYSIPSTFVNHVLFLQSMIAVLSHDVVIASLQLLDLSVLLKFFSYFVSLALNFHRCYDRILVWQSWFQNTVDNFLTGRPTNIGKLKLFFIAAGKKCKIFYSIHDLVTQDISEVVNKFVQRIVNSEASKKIHRWTRIARRKPSFVFWDILSGKIRKVN